MTHPAAKMVNGDSEVPPKHLGNEKDYGPLSTNTVCTECNMRVRTVTIERASFLTHTMALLLCICGCFLCSWMPYCMRSCFAVYHYCPSCGAYLGVHRV